MADPADAPQETISDERFKSAVVNLLAGIEAQLTRIGDNTGHADVHVTEEKIIDAWPYRLYADEVVEVFRTLGITVD